MGLDFLRFAVDVRELGRVYSSPPGCGGDVVSRSVVDLALNS